MKEIYVYNHLGLGDHIIVNGLIRELTKEYDKVIIFVKNHNLNTVENLYFEDKYKFVSVSNDIDVVEYCQLKMIKPLKIGFDMLDTRNQNFDKSFYQQMNINFDKKWSSFSMNRNHDKEDKLFNLLKLENKEYVFVHDDVTKNFKIDDNQIPNNILTIRPEISYSFLDYCKIIENASEIHLMESSYKCLVEHLNIKTKKLFYHKYVRNYPKFISVSTKYKWIDF